ncbi:dihydrofolate reductase family protein [Lentzea aerocolonigenes]|uniref:dihydrofolate reductase family protein n=1 Tax=Lentzea aerocolonigenes TaxID=68170 RepID=UPI0004C3977A|nr:dihydrofolate reductase family protein [Lentzea aerocolonigenes]MCP2247888.1 Dihydrofolate reductase [Lentzea aerocolonigenes]
MRKLVYYVATTLDGYIAAEDGSFDGFIFEGDHMAGINAEYPETVPTQFREAAGLLDAPIRHFDTVLMGRHTYQVPGGLASPYAHLRQFVVSTKVTDTPDDVEVIRSDVAGRVAALKEEDGLDIWLCGGGKLAAELLPLIDKMLIKIHPVVFGRGIPLFDGKADITKFQRTDARLFESGVSFMTYERR